MIALLNMQKLYVCVAISNDGSCFLSKVKQCAVTVSNGAMLLGDDKVRRRLAIVLIANLAIV